MVITLANLFLAMASGRAQPIPLEFVASLQDVAANPTGRLLLADDYSLYGTAAHGGGMFDAGIVFQLATNGSLTRILSFGNTNGANPDAGLTYGADGNFYGTTTGGGTTLNQHGTFFRLTKNGVLTTLFSFAQTNGAQPHGELALGGDGNFYGTTQSGGSYGFGTVYRITTNGELTTLVSFARTNGANPLAGLILGPDGFFYGTTSSGGAFANYGTVFRVTTNGTLTTLASFANSNGASPRHGLTLASDGNFYGTTYSGSGFNIYGSVFRIDTNGVLTNIFGFRKQSDGESPDASLMLGDDGCLYGTTVYGGRYQMGTVFQITTNGIFTSLASFDVNNGLLPHTALTLGADGNFYGASDGGAALVYRLRHGAFIQSCGIATNGFVLNYINVGGSGSVALEASGDLINWTSIMTNGPTVRQFLDTSAPLESQQFYRIIQR